MSSPPHRLPNPLLPNLQTAVIDLHPRSENFDPTIPLHRGQDVPHTNRLLGALSKGVIELLPKSRVKQQRPITGFGVRLIVPPYRPTDCISECSGLRKLEESGRAGLSGQDVDVDFYLWLRPVGESVQSVEGHGAGVVC